MWIIVNVNDILYSLYEYRNKQRYIKIANERKDIYFKGFGLGFIISVIALFMLIKIKMFKITKLPNI